MIPITLSVHVINYFTNNTLKRYNISPFSTSGWIFDWVNFPLETISNTFDTLSRFYYQNVILLPSSDRVSIWVSIGILQNIGNSFKFSIVLLNGIIDTHKSSFTSGNYGS